MDCKEDARKVLEDMRCRMNEKITSGCSNLILQIKESLNAIINSAISNAEKLEEALVLDIEKAEESFRSIKNDSNVREAIEPITEMEIMVDPVIFSEGKDDSIVDVINLEQDEPEDYIPEMLLKTNDNQQKRKTFRCKYSFCDVKFKNQFDLDAHHLLEHKIDGTMTQAANFASDKSLVPKSNSIKRKRSLKSTNFEEISEPVLKKSSGFEEIWKDNSDNDLYKDIQSFVSDQEELRDSVTFGCDDKECDKKYLNPYMLNKHMEKEHVKKKDCLPKEDSNDLFQKFEMRKNKEMEKLLDFDCKEDSCNSRYLTQTELNSHKLEEHTDKFVNVII